MSTVATSHVLQSRYHLRSDGGWVDRAAADIEAMDSEHRSGWVALFDHVGAARPRFPFGNWASAQAPAEQACFFGTADSNPRFQPLESGSEQLQQHLESAGPHPFWWSEFEDHVTRIDVDEVSRRLAAWIVAATKSSVAWLNLPGSNREFLHVLLWTAAAIGTAECVDALRQLAVHSMNHNTPQGATIAVALAAASKETGLAALSLLSDAAKRDTPRRRFERAAAHVARRLGLTPEDAAERFIPSYGLDASGRRRTAIGSHTAEMEIRGGKVVINWSDRTGKRLKKPPVEARKQHAEELAGLNGDAKSIEKLILAQRDRLENLMSVPRSWTFARFWQWYLDHPIVGGMARRLIWVVKGRSALFGTDGAAQDVDGQAVDVSPNDMLEVWHPLGRPAPEVLAWREQLQARAITQPFKQAHREIYLLTDAERSTATYSNRFAAHILRQHQFAQLARGRGWTYSLQGVWDGDGRAIATVIWPTKQIRAELWLMAADVHGHTPNHGILLHVATDQLRFYRENATEPLRLEEVPALVFSEIMRDVDLFVGVASVGNDPTWQDGGPEGRYRAYWQNYSFGELSATAQTRRAVLESLLPRLTKIHDRCRLSDRFLIVRGEIRTYKIHLGSGNILMEPTTSTSASSPPARPMAAPPRSSCLSRAMRPCRSFSAKHFCWRRIRRSKIRRSPGRSARPLKRGSYAVMPAITGLRSSARAGEKY